MGIDRHDCEAAGEQQHPMRAGRAELTQPFQGTPRAEERAPNRLCHRPVTAEHLRARAQRVEPQLQGRTSRRYSRLEHRSRRAHDRGGRQNVCSTQRGQRGVAPGGLRPSGKHFPREQGKRVGGRHRQKAVKPLQFSELPQ
jgi:hypothetical protein